jgi:Na+-driven multidrug efflux pump
VLLSVSILQFVLKHQIISVYASDSKIQKKAFDMKWVISLLTFPDCFKGMLKGVFKSMAL